MVRAYDARLAASRATERNVAVRSVVERGWKVSAHLRK
jgi:hypothetical protein